MDGTGPQRPLGDSQLDRDIESALGIEPSPEFIARVRTRVAAEPEPSPWRLAYVVSAFRRTSIEPLWGVAIVGILMAIVIPQLMREGPVRPAPDRARAVEAGLPADEQAGLVREQAQRSPVLKRAVVGSRSETVRAVPLQLSPALFSERDRQAFELFVVAAGEGRVPEEAANTAGDSGGFAALAIEPLVIDALPVLARVQQQGEGQW